MSPMQDNPGLETLLGQADWLRALAISLLGSRPDADDAVQEVWTAALRSPPDHTRPARPWLAQVLRNVVRARARHSGRRRAHESEAARQTAGEAPSADGVLERMQMHRRLAELVMDLPEPYRTTLLLRFYDGRAAVDLAREANVPEGTVRWRINEGLRRLRERLDQDHGGDRQRWAGVLAPLAGLDRPVPAPVTLAPGGRLPLRLALAGVTGAVGIAIWVVAAHPPAGRGSDPASGSEVHALFHGQQTAEQPRPEKEDPIMKRERLKQVAVLLGVVLPALGAGAGQTEDDRKLEQLAIAACVEMNEKSYECREEFVDAFVELRAGHSRKPMTAEEQAKMRDKAMRDLVERGSGPMERKRAVCEKLIGQMGPRALQGVKTHHPTLQSCYTRNDCKERVACIMPIIGRIHEGEAKRH
jgi:RNA polymerase sigma factor (sigma-70 family)